MQMRVAMLLWCFLLVLSAPTHAQVRSWPGQSRPAAVLILSAPGAPSTTQSKGTFALDSVGTVYVCNASPCAGGSGWVEVNAAAGFDTAGAGLTSSGTTINVAAADSTITVNADSIAVATGSVVTSTTVNFAGAVMESDYDAQTVLAATTDNTPAALTVAEQRVVGRATGSNVAALTGAQVGAMVALGDLSDVDATSPSSANLLTWDGDSWGPAAPAVLKPGPQLFAFYGDDTGAHRSTTSTVTIGSFAWRPATYDSTWTHVRIVALLSSTAAGAEPVNINLIRTQLFGGSEGSGTELALISQSSIAGGTGAWSVVTVLIARSSLSSSDRHYSIQLTRGGATGSVLCQSIVAYLTTSTG